MPTPAPRAHETALGGRSGELPPAVGWGGTAGARTHPARAPHAWHAAAGAQESPGKSGTRRRLTAHARAQKTNTRGGAQVDPGRRGLSTAPRGLEVPPASSRVTSTVRPRHHRGPQPGSARAAHSGGWRDSGVFRPSAPSAARSGRRAERVHVAMGQAHVGGGCREVWAGLRPTPHTRRRPPSPTTGRRPRALSVPPDPAE